MDNFDINKNPKIESGFKVPDNYFENFKVDLTPESPTIQLSFYNQHKIKIFKYAASIAIGLMCSLYFLNTKTTQDISTLEIENYLITQSNLSQYDLMSDLDEADIEDLKNQVTNLDKE
jgi:hypothetical protein